MIKEMNKIDVIYAQWRIYEKWQSPQRLFD